VSDEKTSLAAALRHLAEQERRTPSEHATPGELTAYHEGTLPPPVEARVREHLAHCKLCSDLLLDLAGFADLAPPPGVPELTDAEVEKDWQALRARMGAEQGNPRVDEKSKQPGEVVPIRPAKPEVGKRERDLSPWKIAAAILIAAVALIASLTVLKQWTSKPEPVSIAEFSDGDQLRGSSPGKLPRMTSSQEARFTFHSPDSYPGYNGEIVADRTVIWQTRLGSGQTPAEPQSDLKEISFRVPSDSLEPGQYEARVFGIGVDGRRELIGRLDFEVDAP
jgi:hypothetical protein